MQEIFRRDITFFDKVSYSACICEMNFDLLFLVFFKTLFFLNLPFQSEPYVICWTSLNLAGSSCF